MALNEETPPQFFEDVKEFRKWLTENHRSEKAIWLGFYKKSTGKKSIDWPGSVDQALCFGWIDGIRKSIDEKSYKIRFTPRKPGSHWSKVNIQKIKELKKKNLLLPDGLKAFEKRKKERTGLASFEQGDLNLPEEFNKEFRKSKGAYSFFRSKAPSYQKQCVWWIVSAKREETRQKRFKILVNSCAQKELAPPFRWSKKKE